MYFFKNKGKQYLDLTGNLILSHNDRLVKARVKSAAPVKVLSAKYVLISTLNIKNKIIATWMVLIFIWGKSSQLIPNDTDLNLPKVKIK